MSPDAVEYAFAWIACAAVGVYALAVVVIAHATREPGE